ncbi:MAG: hypothetical protein HQK65_06215, partial [Desulfamplus sp.]|nr:hypothetical protein [Desulfamplus sp.]
EKVLQCIARIIRWQTLRGQQDRCSASKSILPTDLQFSEFLSEEENNLLSIITKTDAFLKTCASHNEKKVEEIVSNIDITNYKEILQKLSKPEEFKLNWKHEQASQCDDTTLVNKQNPIIWSYFPRKLVRFKNNIIGKLPTGQNTDNCIYHINLDRSIRDSISSMNQISSINNGNDFKLDKIDLQGDPELLKKLFPTIKTYVVRLNPKYMIMIKENQHVNQ